MKVEDGGAAFPRVKGDKIQSYETHPGMSLRDWFAGQALSHLCSKTSTWDAELAAMEAYAFADAMLKERSK